MSARKSIDPDFAPGITQQIDTRTLIRGIATTEPEQTRIIPLCKRLPEDGSITLKYNKLFDEYIGLFSFTIYLLHKSLETFRKSPYFIGLLLYAEFIHNLPYFNNVGMILYTDEESYPILHSVFGNYEKVIFAITEWPAFAIGKNIEPTILRCMRVQAVEAFPDKWICVRDADTIFPHTLYLTDYLYSFGWKGANENGTIIEDYRRFLMERIGFWEQLFIDKWLNDPKNPICFGVDPRYMASWHMNSIIRWPTKMNEDLHARVSNYQREKKGPPLKFEAPFGIYAGFTNFSATSPRDIWALSVDYITARYSIVNRSTTPAIDNSIRGWQDGSMAIGKDERILLFAIMPKYIDIIYFFWISYEPNIGNKTKNVINELARSSFETIGIPETNILTFNVKQKKDPLAAANGIALVSFNSYDTIHIRTLLLQPLYVNTVYSDIKLNPALIKKVYPSRRLLKFLPVEIDKKELLEFNLSDLYKAVFKKFIIKYNKWLATYMTMPNSDFSDIITKLKRGHPEDYGTLNNSDFNSPPGRIFQSRLGGRRIRRKTTKTTKTRKTRKTRKIHKR
jgi:hypothetical protein